MALSFVVHLLLVVLVRLFMCIPIRSEVVILAMVFVRVFLIAAAAAVDNRIVTVANSLVVFICCWR